MSHRWSWTLLGMAALLVSPRAAAEGGDGSHRTRLTVIHDTAGRYLFVDPVALDQIYYGKAGNYYELRLFGYSATDPNGRLSLRFWSPRTRDAGELSRDADGEWSLRCGRRRVELAALADEEAEALVAKATFHRPSWNRRPYALARNEAGVYYYVDKLLGRFARDFRLFVGRRGQMTEIPLEDVLRDRDGDVFATGEGELEFFWGAAPVAEWSTAEARTSLTFVPVEKNPTLIYSDLGVYRGPLGTPCDDF